METSRLLVVSRVENQKILPWMVSSTGAVRCFDTVSLSQKLSLHRHAKVPILIHVLLWDRLLVPTSAGQTRLRAASPSALQLPSEVQSTHYPNDNQLQPPPPPQDQGESRVCSDRLERDTAGELSFRFHEFALSSNWV